MPKELTHWYLAIKVGEALGAGDSFHKDSSPAGRVQANVRDGKATSPTDPEATGPKATGREGSATPQPRISHMQSSFPFPTLTHCIQACPHSFLLGAVGPDFLFYYLKGPELQRFREAAMVLHGRDGGNTLRPFASVAETYGGKFGWAVGAFLLGYLVHVMGDAVFHPLVLYSVGKGPGRPQYEHHVFESALDLYVLHRWGRGEQEAACLPITLKEIIRRMTESGECARREFLQLLGVVSFLGKPYDSRELARCLSRYEWLQAWFWSPLACQATRVLKALNPTLAFLEASCYQPRFYRYAEALDRILEYRHPVTGVSRQVRIEELVQETEEQFFTFAPRLEKLFHVGIANVQVTLPGSDRSELPADLGTLKRGAQGRASPVGESEEVQEGFQSLKGPNLETGLFGDRADRILYTRPEGLEGLFGPYGYRYGYP